MMPAPLLQADGFEQPLGDAETVAVVIVLVLGTLLLYVLHLSRSAAARRRELEELGAFGAGEDRPGEGSTEDRP